jgi:hypothetical protein
MKSIVVLFFVVFLFACNNETKSPGGEAPNTTNVENVDGSIPDTSNSATLNRPMEKDSSKVRDSVPE